MTRYGIECQTTPWLQQIWYLRCVTVPWNTNHVNDLQWLMIYVTSLWSMHVSSISNQMFLLSLGGPLKKTRSCSCSTWLMLQSTVSFMMLLKLLFCIQDFSIVLKLYFYKCIAHNGESTGPVFVHYSYSTNYENTNFLSWNHYRTLSILDIILHKIIIVQQMSIND